MSDRDRAGASLEDPRRELERNLEQTKQAQARAGRRIALGLVVAGDAIAAAIRYHADTTAAAARAAARNRPSPRGRTRPRT